MGYVVGAVGLLLVLGVVLSALGWLVVAPVSFVLLGGPTVLGTSAAVAVCVAVPVGLWSGLALVRARNGHRRHTAWPVRGTRLDALAWTMWPAAILGAFAWPDLLLLRDERWGAFGAVGIPVLAPTLALLLPVVGLLLWQWLPAARAEQGRETYCPVADQTVVRTEASWIGSATGAVRDEVRLPGEVLLAPPSRQWPREALAVATAGTARATPRLRKRLGRYVLFMAVLLALLAGLAAPADPRVRWYTMGDVTSAFLADGVAYVTYEKENGSRALSARNALTGEENWRVPLPTRTEGDGGNESKAGSGGKTSHDEGKDNVYVGGRAVNALATRDGSVRWTYSAPKDTPELQFSRPVVAGRQILVAATDGTLRVLDSRTGKLRWKKRWGVDENGDGTPYSLEDLPPFLVNHGRVYLARPGAVEVYDAGSGKDRWKIGIPGDDSGYDTVRITATADVVYAASGKTLSAFKGLTGKRLWSTSLAHSFSPGGFTVSGDSLFLKDDDHLRRFAARSGKLVWNVDVQGASVPVVVGDRVILGYDQKITCFRVSSATPCGAMSTASVDETLADPGGSIVLVDHGNFVEVLSSDLRPRDTWNARQLLRGWGATIW
ncbi:outer membrane protein assembly factor BamB family protein [Streptomyces tropicalis]|uniref:PQQ-binding-like beta-propeller repeat protein n=1 Tax=Streptomyces tropicalis TaxID=3034234 RepID=A0ABT6A5X0_9ACTN|nr:PQQ-binding-like beta-propeller repeat protein [Streptomyces tropicalis]MDF3300046.1 PQQ-binding-like beta-propeller repeat protein [Streptomyces tropicalis]